MSETPHDSLFRFAFTQPAVAADHFRTHLPASVAAAARWETLQVRPGTFVDERLKHVHSDVLYRVAMADGSDLWLYVLFEHQSTPDPMMAWRLLRYMVRIWDQALSETGSGNGLPCIVPMVLYNGEQPWSVSEDFHGLFASTVAEELQGALFERVPQFRYVLQALSETEDAELQGMALRRLVLLVLKYAREGEFWRLPEWMDTFVTVAGEPDGLRAIEAVWRYIPKVTPREPPEEVLAALVTRLSPEGQRVVMSWGDILENRGLQRGLQQGLEQGHRQGRVQTLLELMQAKYGALSSEIVARVEAAGEEELGRWTMRILTAETVEALLG